MTTDPSMVGLEYGGLEVVVDMDRCGECRRRINWHKATFGATDRPSRRFNLFSSSDGYYVASEKFRKFCVDEEIEGVRFVKLQNGYSVMMLERCISVDYSRLNNIRDGWCDTCKSYRRNLLVTPLPIIKEDANVKPMEMVETCDRWGEEIIEMHTAQPSQLIVGEGVKRAIEKHKFRNISFIDVV